VLIPSALIDNLAVELLPAGDFFFGIDEGKDGAGINLDVGVTSEFEHAESVGDFFVAPLVARDDGNAKDVDVGGLQEEEHGLLVCGGGATSVLIEG